MEGRVQMSRLLLQLGADVNAADSYGTTPLAAAARRGLSLQVPLYLSLCFYLPFLFQTILPCSIDCAL